jgi:type IV pilus assembly protein PilQ
MNNIQNQFIRVCALALVAGLAAFMLTLPAHADITRSLKAIDVVALDSERAQITLTLSESAPEPVIFTIDRPARLSLDIPETRLDMDERTRKVGVGKVDAFTVAEAKGRTRVVLELSQLTPHSFRVEGDKIILQLGRNVVTATAPVAESEQAAPASEPVSSNEPVSREVPNISALDFRRGEKGEGRVLVTLKNLKTPVDVREEGGKVIAKFKNAIPDEDLLRRLDVVDFATPVKFIDVKREGVNTIITITPVEKADFEQVAYQTGDQFTLELQPLTQDKADERKKLMPQYTGERISLNFQSVDVRQVLQIIGDVANSNMVISDSVTGEIALRLQNVPWDQALEIILRSKGLGMRKAGNVIQVAPATELAQRDKEELESQKQKVDLSPLRSEIIQINYAKASDLRALITTDKSTLLSDRGRISVDERTNTLIVLESRDKIAEIRELIGKLDIPVRQVLIESRIVVANDDYSRDLGARFGVSAAGTGAGSASSNTLFGTTGTSTTDNPVTGTNPALPITAAQPGNFNVNLPAAGAASTALAILSSGYRVDLELSALQTEGRGEVVSTPRVITANGKQAIIRQGQQIPYQTVSTTGTQTLFKDAVLSLTVTPQITPDNRVLMDIIVTNDTKGADVNTGIGSAPAIDTRSVTTQSLVKTGETVVLGGVYVQNKNDSISKVPVLGDIPYLGRLFRRDTNTKSKRELLIFVTPKILQEGLRVN